MSNPITRNSPFHRSRRSTDHRVRVAIGPRGRCYRNPLEQCARLGTTVRLTGTQRWQNGSQRPSLPKVTSTGLDVRAITANDFQPTQEDVTSRSLGDIDPRSTPHNGGFSPSQHLGSPPPVEHRELFFGFDCSRGDSAVGTRQSEETMLGYLPFSPSPFLPLCSTIPRPPVLTRTAT